MLDNELIKKDFQSIVFIRKIVLDIIYTIPGLITL